MTNEEKSDLFFLKKLKNNSVMDVYPKGPDIESFGMEFLNFQRGVKRVIFEEIGFLDSLALNLGAEPSKKFVKCLRGDNCHLLGDKFRKGIPDREASFLNVIFRFL